MYQRVNGGDSGSRWEEYDKEQIKNLYGSAKAQWKDFSVRSVSKQGIVRIAVSDNLSWTREWQGLDYLFSSGTEISTTPFSFCFFWRL